MDAISDVKTQLFDGVHPNNIGYKAIGEKYSEAILDYFNEKGITPEELPTAEASTGPAEEKKFTISDLVKMSRYLLGYSKEIIYTAEEIARYDMNKDGKADVYDLVLARKAILIT